MPSADAWREELRRFPRLALRPGCSSSAIAEAEQRLGIQLPAELVEFLTATDGVYDEENRHVFAWPLATIVSQNLTEHLVLPDDLLGIGDDAAGDWFCLSLKPGGGPVHYGWIGNERRTVAKDLIGLWVGWFGGEFSV